jgi:polyhydroxyalkanoate synthesis regulator protein
MLAREHHETKFSVDILRIVERGTAYSDMMEKSLKEYTDFSRDVQNIGRRRIRSKEIQELVAKILEWQEKLNR